MTLSFENVGSIPHLDVMGKWLKDEKASNSLSSNHNPVAITITENELTYDYCKKKFQPIYSHRHCTAYGCKKILETDYIKIHSICRGSYPQFLNSEHRPSWKMLIKSGEYYVILKPGNTYGDEHQLAINVSGKECTIKVSLLENIEYNDDFEERCMELVKYPERPHCMTCLQVGGTLKQSCEHLLACNNWDCSWCKVCSPC